MELKPCPFCGEPAWKGWDTEYPEWPVYLVRCISDQCSVEVQVFAETEEEAVAQWNTREVGDE